jgi:hypothetical protein
LVRCRVIHFERPANEKNSARSLDGQNVGMPRNSDTRWV